MHGMGCAAQLVSAFSTKIFCIISILYEDDMDLFAIAEWVAHRMQAMTSHWQGCLLVTGEDLNPDKSSWTPLVFIGMPMGNGIIIWMFLCPICIPNSLGVLHALEHLAPLASTTIVGVVHAIDGNMLDQVAALKAFADDMGNCIHNGYLPKCLIWQTL
jgi:hypothetical protein